MMISFARYQLQLASSTLRSSCTPFGSSCLSQAACASVVTTPAGSRLVAGWFTLRDGPSKIYQQIA